MTIDKAIKELIELNENHFSQGWAEPNEAVRLGIEALKQMAAERTIFGFKRHVRMPGETEE